jgi:hypothetical protein
VTELLDELRTSNEGRLDALAVRGLPLDTDVDRIGTMLETLLRFTTTPTGDVLLPIAQLLHEQRIADKLDKAEQMAEAIEAEGRRRQLQGPPVAVGENGRLHGIPGRL